jgi:DNA-3-methyladenine glycosylase II
MQLGEIAVREPFPWPQLIGYLSLRLIPELESIENGSYLRRVARHTVTVSYDARHARLRVVMSGRASGRVRAEQTLAVVRRLFDTDYDATSVQRHLRRSQPLQTRIAAVPGMRPLGAWSPFELCLRTVLGQQVTVAAATTLMRRLVQRCGGMVTPECILAADLSNMGMPGKRVETLRALSRAILEQRLDFAQPWTQVDAMLQALPGFGPWTRAYLAIRLGRDPDAFPATDVGLIRAANVPDAPALLALAESWRPWRAYAATYLWTVVPQPQGARSSVEQA